MDKLYRSKERTTNVNSLDVFKKRAAQRKEQNDMLIARVVGVPAQPNTPETDNDPSNSNNGASREFEDGDNT